MARSPSGESLLTRVVRILEQFGPTTPTLSVSALARRADLPVSTTHRLVGELCGYGLLEQTADKQVRIGLRLWEISHRSSQVLGVREAALPFLEDLHAVVRQHVSLGVLDGSDVLYLERLSAREAVVGNLTKVAGRLPAYAVSAGLVLLAFAPSSVRQEVLDGPLEPLTDRTVTDPDRLRRIFADARRAGFVAAPGFIDPDATGVAVPVRGASGDVVAAISVTVPLGDNPSRLLPALMASARGVSRAMGAAVRLSPDEVVRTRGVPSPTVR